MARSAAGISRRFYSLSSAQARRTTLRKRQLDRAAKKIELKKQKAKRRRKRSINLVKRLNNQDTLENLSECDFRGGITARYSPQWMDPTLDPGYTL